LQRCSRHPDQGNTTRIRQGNQLWSTEHKCRPSFDGQDGSAPSDDPVECVRPDCRYIKAQILLWATHFDDDSAMAPVLTSPLDGRICAL
jgi:hypothetical protein